MHVFVYWFHRLCGYRLLYMVRSLQHSKFGENTRFGNLGWFSYPSTSTALHTCMWYTCTMHNELMTITTCNEMWFSWPDLSDQDILAMVKIHIYTINDLLFLPFSVALQWPPPVLPDPHLDSSSIPRITSSDRTEPREPYRCRRWRHAGWSWWQNQDTLRERSWTQERIRLHQTQAICKEWRQYNRFTLTES